MADDGMKQIVLGSIKFKSFYKDGVTFLDHERSQSVQASFSSKPAHKSGENEGVSVKIQTKRAVVKNGDRSEEGCQSIKKDDEIDDVRFDNLSIGENS